MNIEEILRKHVGEDGKIDQEAAAKELKEVQGKEFVPKDDFNSKNEELKKANDTLETLQKDNKDVETLQTTIKNYETEVEELKQEATKQAKEFALKTALTNVGAEDVDYFADKLADDVELNDKGELEGFEDKIKDYQTKHPKLFKQVDDKKKDKDGMTIIDNKLDKGERSPSLTKEKIMEIEDTTERQQKIKENMDLFK